MEPRISFVTLGISDLERSVKFYRDGLGFPLSSASKDDVAFFKTGGCLMRPGQPSEPGSRPRAST